MPVNFFFSRKIYPFLRHRWMWASNSWHFFVWVVFYTEWFPTQVPVQVVCIQICVACKAWFGRWTTYKNLWKRTYCIFLLLGAGLMVCVSILCGCLSGLRPSTEKVITVPVLNSNLMSSVFFGVRDDFSRDSSSWAGDSLSLQIIKMPSS